MSSDEIRELKERIKALEEWRESLRCHEQAPNLPAGVTCLKAFGHDGDHEQRILMGAGKYQIVKWS